MTRSTAGDRPGERIGPALLVILATFALSRLALYSAGVRFDASTLSWYHQYIEPALLRDRLFESLLNLHSQPPGFNLALGLALKLAPVHFAALIHGAYVLLGGLATSSLGAYLGARRLVRASGLVLNQPRTQLHQPEKRAAAPPVA